MKRAEASVMSCVNQADDADGEGEERAIVDDQGTEGDVDATDVKRRGKQEEEVRGQRAGSLS